MGVFSGLDEVSIAAGILELGRLLLFPFTGRNRGKQIVTR
jgi:hypothetical protein